MQPVLASYLFSKQILNVSICLRQENVSHTGSDPFNVYGNNNCGIFGYKGKKNTVVSSGSSSHQIRQRKNSNFINKNAAEEETDE